MSHIVRAVFALGLSALVIVGVGCGDEPAGNPNNQSSSFAPATVALVQLSTDTFTNSTSQHATEVEPDSFSVGSTIVAAFQVGRVFSGGSSDIGFAVSTNAGATWQNGFLPGLTTFQGAGTNSAVSDPSVVFDGAHGVWIITSLTIASSGVTQVVVSSSPDALNWSNPTAVSHTPSPDKDWITCDNTPTSPFYGHCYIEWDDSSQADLIWMSTSTDGGQTWSAAVNTGNSDHGIGGVPLVQPNGTVIVPMLVFPGIASFSSTNGGASWKAAVPVAALNDHQVAGGLRTDALPSANIDAAGNVYVVWQDCSFRVGCTSNDLVMSTSPDGTNWTTPARIPIDAVNSSVDHFIPGLGIDPATSGGTTHLGLTYYYYPQTNCSVTTCALFVGIISSIDGGNTWSAPRPIAGPMSLSWLPATFSGQMVGDYVATSFAGGKAYGVFAVAKANSGTTFNQAIYTTQSGFDLAAAQGRFSSAGEQPVPNAESDHPPSRYFDLEHLHPRPVNAPPK